MTNYERNRRNTSSGAFIQYAANKDMYQRTTCRIRSNGTVCWLLDGKEIEDKDFRSAYPIGLIDKSRHSDRADSRQGLFYN